MFRRLLICNLYQFSIHYINSERERERERERVCCAQYSNTLIHELFEIKGFINQHIGSDQLSLE